MTLTAKDLTEQQGENENIFILAVFVSMCVKDLKKVTESK